MDLYSLAASVIDGSDAPTSPSLTCLPARQPALYCVTSAPRYVDTAIALIVCGGLQISASHIMALSML